MAHCPFDKLADLHDVFERLRTLPFIKELKPGIFYLKSKGFLHFHTDGVRRWADVRDGASWGKEIETPFGISAKAKAAFLKETLARYERTVGAKGRRNP